MLMTSSHSKLVILELSKKIDKLEHLKHWKESKNSKVISQN